MKGAETLSKKLEQQPIRAALQRELGASACGSCTLMKLGCPGKAEAVQDCPPQAEKIQQAELTRAIVDDDSATSVYADKGGFYVLSDKASKLQSAIVKTEPSPLKKPQKPAVKSALKLPERKKTSSQPGFLEFLGEFAAALLLIGSKTK